MLFWMARYETDVESGFYIRKANEMEMLIARFVASMMMHIKVQKDVQGGLKMMKYAVNHYDNFTNFFAPFLLSFMSTIIALWVEVNVMIIMANLADILSVILKYISLASIVNIPREYFASIK